MASSVSSPSEEALSDVSATCPSAAGTITPSAPLCARRERHIFLLENLDGYGLAKEITLHFVAAQQSELTQLLLCLDTLRYRIELKFVRQINDDRDQCQPTWS